MLFLLVSPRAHRAFLWGNTDMWMAAGVAAGLRWGWPALVLTLKPSLVFFALVGGSRRSFWLAALVMVAFVVLTLPMWIDYLTVIRNTRLPLDYSLRSIPLLLLPLVAWLGMARPTAAAGPTTDHRSRWAASSGAADASPSVARMIRRSPPADRAAR